MTTPWTQNIRHIQNGESVSAGVAGRPDRSLEGNARYLKERLDALELGQALFAYDLTVEPDALVGQPVYYNAVTSRYELALAGVETDEDTGTLVAKKSADPIGIVFNKTSSTLADIMLLGYGAVDLSNAVDGDLEPGRYYLSSAAPGKLVKQRPPVSVAVLFADGVGNVVVLPQMRDFIEDHVHYAFDLVCRPAGQTSPPATGERHVIHDEEALAQGWLPASNSIFGGLAPSRAAFGYNLAAHPELQALWPPIPLEAVSAFWDKGQNLIGATEVPLGRTGLVVVDENGIWWMSDCYGDVPWPTNFNNIMGASSSSITSASPECARDEEMRLRLYYAKMVFATDDSAVTSLRVAEGSPITLRNVNGLPNATGNLEIDIASAQLSGELHADVTRLVSVEESYADNVLYWEFPQATAASLRGKIKIPSQGLPGTPLLKLRFQILGLVAGTLPNLTLAYRLLTAPSNGSEEVLPTSDTSLGLTTSQLVNAGRYISADSDGISVSEGDTVLFALSRSASDSYLGSLGLLDAVGVLYSGA